MFPKHDKIPAFKFLILLIPAIIVGNYIPLSEVELLIFSIISIIISIILLKYKLNSIAYLILILIAGFYISSVANRNYIEKPNKVIPSIEGIFTGKIIHVKKKTENYVRLIAEGTLDLKGYEALPEQRIILMYFNRNEDEEINDIKEGAEFYSEVNCNFQAPKLIDGEFDMEQYLFTSGINWNCVTSEKKFAIKSFPNQFDSFISKIKSKIDMKIDQLYPQYSAGIVKAMLLGDKSEIDQETKQVFSYSGTAHLLAISGLHIGIIVASVHFLLVPLFRSRYLKFIVFTVVLVLFIIVSGVQDSAVRAGSMAILWSMSYLTKRRIEPLNAASLVLLAMVLIDPSYIYSVSFQMSASAILGILLFYNVIRYNLKLLINSNNIFIKFVRESIALTLSACIVVSPLVAYYFGIYSIISPIANLFVLPLMSLGLLYSIISLLFSFISIYLAHLFANTSMLFIELSDILNKLLIDLPHSYIDDKSIAITLSILISASILYFILSDSRKKAFFRVTLSGFAILVIYLYFNVQGETIESDFAIYPREQLVMFEFERNEESNIILLDRKPSIRPKTDIGVVNYLMQKDKKLNIFYTGNAGINISDKIKYEKEVQLSEISILEQKELFKLIDKDVNLIQEIE